VRHERLWPAHLLALLLLISCDKTPTSTDSPTPSQEATIDETVSQLETAAHGEPFDIAEVFFEFNTTDDDLGFQLFLDAEGWRRVTLHNPSDNRLLQVLADGPLANLGITELRFESAEPSPQAVLRRFPNGIDGKAFYQQRAPDDVPPVVRVETVRNDEGEEQARIIGGDLLTLLKRYDAAERALNTAVRLSSERGDTRLERSTLRSVGLLRWHQDRHLEALEIAQKALAFDRAFGDTRSIIGDLSNVERVLVGLDVRPRA
jgi:tetratricopeptide (TPR) repeat protein